MLDFRSVLGIVPAVLGLSLALASCSQPTTYYSTSVQASSESRSSGDAIAESIAYIRDKRTGLCFAYMWGGMANGGPALASVDCASVEKFLVN